MSKVLLAAALSRYAHAGQVDKAGKPYWRHPKAVADMLSGDTEKIVGYLHDVLEDTDINESTIRRMFGDTVADAVVNVTHNPGEEYFDYIQRVKQNPISRKVKLADLEHNMDLSRLPVVTEKDRKRLEKYKRAKEILE